MFDIAPSELLLVAIVALLVIGPKDLPLALRTAGKWLGKVRRMSGHFRAGVETMIREAELADIEKEWRERNSKIMAEHPDGEMLAATAKPPYDVDVMGPLENGDVSAEARLDRSVQDQTPTHNEPSEVAPPRDPPTPGRV